MNKGRIFLCACVLCVCVCVGVHAQALNCNVNVRSCKRGSVRVRGLLYDQQLQSDSLAVRSIL